MQINRVGAVQPIVTDIAIQPVKPVKGNIEGSNFRQVLEKAAVARDGGLHFSKHANMRLDARNLSLDPAQMQRVEDGVARARVKGIRESLVLVDNIALVVNVTNRVVVTALNQQDQVFTNIDGAVIV